MATINCKSCDWDEKSTTLLINLFKANECLYNVFHKDYKNAHAKLSVMTFIANIICRNTLTQCTVNEVESKITALKSQYCEEKLKRDNLGTLCNAGDNLIRSLQFLDQYSHEDKSQANDDTSLPSNDDTLDNLPSHNAEETMDKSKSTRNVKKKKNKRFKCTLCPKFFLDRGSLTKHLPTHSTETPFPCTQCAYAGKTRQYLRRHVKVTHERDRKFECEECGKTFHFGCKLKDHMRVHTGEKPNKCDVCGKAFNSTYSLSTHKLIHTGSKPFKCSFCPYACRDSSSLRKHQARHMGTEKYYQCTMCKTSVKSKARLKLHVAEKHLNIDVNNYVCDICGKRFKIKSVLSLHIQGVHERSRTAKCGICGILLSDKSNLPAHMRIHVDEKPYVCTVELCEKRFKHTSSLTKHIRWHYPSKQFGCVVCNKRFLTNKSLKRHRNTHRAKVKRVECDYCSVRFYNKNYLVRHIQRKHGRKKQKYICDMCDFKTTNKPSIVMHIKYGHDVHNYIQCEICEKKFKRDFNLKLHYWNAHEIKYKITARPKKKPKKPILTIKEEPKDYDDDEYFEVIPKIEPLDDEQMLFEDLASTNEALQDIPENVFEEFIAKREKLPDDNIHPQKAFVDQNSEEQVKKGVKQLLERTRQKIAALALERARKKYNRLMRRAVKMRKVQRLQIRERKKVKCDNNNKEDTNSLLVEDYSISHDAIEKEHTINKAKVTANKQTMDNQMTTNSLLVEDYSISHDAIEKEHIEKAKAIANIKNIDNKTSTNVLLVEDYSISHDAIGKEHTEKANKATANIKSINNQITSTNPLLVEDILVEKEKVNKESTDNQITEVEKEHTIDKTKASGNQETKHEELNKEVENTTVDTQSTEELKDTSDVGRNRKLKLNLHQCYVCFKLFQTKQMLLEHCKDHFDQYNIKTLKKCPLCEYTTNLSVTKHLKQVHNINIKVPYGTVKEKANNEGTAYYYEVGDKVIDKIDIIPSIKNLNRREAVKIDKKNRDTKNKAVMKTKLVKKGKEWIVVKEKIKIKDYMLPKFHKTLNVNVKGNYIDKMKALSRVAKKNGAKMLFPCDSCEKICQTLAALKLHGRKHEANPKPFKPKVWKHKSKPDKKSQTRKQSKKRPVKQTTSENSNIDNKQAHRHAKPNPVVTKHRCTKELIEFYERNIKGGDIEFWQFLKIYNKMGREHENDFADLDNTNAYGVPCDPEENRHESEVRNEESEVNRKKSVRNKSEVNKRKTVRRDAFQRVVRLSKKEVLKRNKIRMKLRQQIQHNN